MNKSQEKEIAEQDNPESLDALRLRARARDLLQHGPPGGPSYIVCQFVGQIGERGAWPPRANWEFTSAETQCVGHPDRSFQRGESETVEEFKTRVISSLPAVSEYCPVALFFSPNLPEAPLAVIDTGPPDEPDPVTH